jgi:hypothetical protein
MSEPVCWSTDPIQLARAPDTRPAPYRAPLANQAGKTGTVAILPLKIEAEMPPHYEDLLWRRLSLGQTFATLTKFWNFEMKQFGDT